MPSLSAPSDVPDLDRHPFRIANFRRYWVARLAGTLAQSALVLIIGWQVYGIARAEMSVRESAFLLGMIGLVQFVPLFFLTPVTGWVADRFDRRRIGQVTIFIQLCCASVLGLLTWRGDLGLVALFGVAFFLGIARAFSGPAFSALAPNLVPRKVLPTAIAVSSIAWQAGMIAGPSIGGAMYAIHPDAAYGLCTTLFLIALVGVISIRPVAQPAMLRDRKPLQQMIDGLSYVRKNRLVLATITLDLFAVMLAGATALLPVFARDILHVGAAGLGILASSMGAGAAVTAIWFSIRPMHRNVGVKMLAAVFIFGSAIIVFGLSQYLWLSVAALVVAGGADMVSVYVRQSLIQLHTPDAMRGRVSSVSLLTISASNELGETESGLLASLLGPVAAVVAGGIGAIVITIAWARLFPELRLAKSFDPPDMDDEPTVKEGPP
ncbi:MFS transporter [Sphingorhabdus soli]|uniref:MFS transporter n=1 Tax=Flavisphingopyxis soli TaxID=2601267 RepID=A0A5C6UUB3_9SPHN|nr:MFS transporter [Sphingorhabdus soli]TXC74275.1 MFS transporter [Sphingorhabdus soli]